MLITGQSPSEKISPEFQIVMDRVKEKTDIVFEKFPDAFEGVTNIMDQAKDLFDYYEKFEAYLDSYLKK